MAASQGSSAGTMQTSKTTNTRASSLASGTVRGGRCRQRPCATGVRAIAHLFIQSTFAAAVSGMVM